jgi:hypothetical protein
VFTSFIYHSIYRYGIYALTIKTLSHAVDLPSSKLAAGVVQSTLDKTPLAIVHTTLRGCLKRKKCLFASNLLTQLQNQAWNETLV